MVIYRIKKRTIYQCVFRTHRRRGKKKSAPHTIDWGGGCFRRGPGGCRPAPPHTHILSMRSMLVWRSMSEAVRWLSIILLTGDVAGQQQQMETPQSCGNFPSTCRMDLCRDLGEDCCAATEVQSCMPGYVVYPAAHDCPDGVAFQCCAAGHEPAKLCSDEIVGGYICGQFGCMKDSDDGSCLPDAEGLRPAGCQPTIDCVTDHGGVDARASMITCGRERCYVPWTGKGANAEEVRQTGAGCLGLKHGEDGGGAVNLEWVAPVLVAVAALVLLDGIRKSIHQVSQREVIVIERFGRYHKTLTAGLSFVVPFIDQPKRYSEKYILTDANGVTQVKQKINAYKISTQEEVCAPWSPSPTLHPPALLADQPHSCERRCSIFRSSERSRVTTQSSNSTPCSTSRCASLLLELGSAGA